MNSCKLSYLTRTIMFALVASATVAGRAAIMIEADRAYPAGAPLFTVDPELTASPNARNVAADRLLRQSFQLTQSVEVSEIVLSLGIESETGGLDVTIHRVADVNADTFASSGVVTSFSIADPLPIASENRTGLLFSDADVFVLGPRAGTAGYAIEISNSDDATNVGPLRHTNTDGGAIGNAADYPNGKFYTESGGQSGPGGRDIGLAINGTIVPEPSAVLLAAFAVAGAVLSARRK